MSYHSPDRTSQSKTSGLPSGRRAELTKQQRGNREPNFKKPGNSRLGLKEAAESTCYPYPDRLFLRSEVGSLRTLTNQRITALMSQMT